MCNCYGNEIAGWTVFVNFHFNIVLTCKIPFLEMDLYADLNQWIYQGKSKFYKMKE